MAGGRPSKYDVDIHPAWAWSLAKDGLTEKEIASKMDIALSTFSEWKGKYSEFSDAVKMGKEPADSKVEQSLFKRANGYTIRERKTIVEMDKNGEQKPVRIETIEKHVPPDTGAACMWLKNRLPDKWRDKPESTATDNVDESVKYWLRASAPSKKDIAALFEEQRTGDENGVEEE